MDEQKRFEKLLKRVLDKEAENTIEEVEADESLKNLTLPDELDAGLRAKIEQYEMEKAAYDMLSNEDKEAIRIGREFQILRTNEDCNYEEEQPTTRKKSWMWKLFHKDTP